MNKEQIQALIDAKIAGQGTMVDVGGALPTILTEILNLASAGQNVQPDWNQQNNTEPDYIKNKPVTHVLEVLEEAEDETSLAEVLPLLKFDGETPTVEQLKSINPLNTIVEYDGKKLAIGGVDTNYNSLIIYSGYVIPGETQTQIEIYLSETENSGYIVISEI